MYNKLLVGKTIEISKDLGLIAELTESTKDGQANVFSLWLQYKDDNGDWAYKGTKGATSIRLALTEDVGNYIIESVKLALEANKKALKAKKNAPATFDVKALNSLSDEQKAQLLLALTGQAKQVKEPEQELAFSNEILKMLGGKNTKKTKK